MPIFILFCIVFFIFLSNLGITNEKYLGFKKFYYSRGEFDEIVIIKSFQNMESGYYSSDSIVFLSIFLFFVFFISISFLFLRYYDTKESEIGERLSYLSKTFSVIDIALIFLISFITIYFFDYIFEMYLDLSSILILMFFHVISIFIYYSIRVIFDIKKLSSIEKKKENEIKTLKNKIESYTNKNKVKILND